jgi:hypothetical protein
MSRLHFLDKYAIHGRHFNPDEEVNKILTDEKSSGHKIAAALSSKFTKPEVLDSYVSHPNYAIRVAVAKNPNIRDDQVSKLITDDDTEVSHTVIKNKNVKQHHIDHLVSNDPNNPALSDMIRDKDSRITDKHINELINNPAARSTGVRSTAARYSKTSENVQNAINTRNPSIMQHAMHSFAATDKQLDWGVNFSNHGYSGVSMAAVKSRELRQFVDDLDSEKNHG